MVRKFTEEGIPYREPPFTPEEEAELQARVNHPPVTIVWSTPLRAWTPMEPAAKVTEQESPQPPQEEPHRS